MALADDLPNQRFIEIADGIVAVVHGDGSAGVANSAMVLEGGSALVVDAMLLPAMAARVAGEVRRRGARPDVVLNTHHHLDHVGGNAAFEGARLAGHPVSTRIVEGLVGRAGELGQVMPRFAAALTSLDVRPAEPSARTLVPPRGGRLLTFSRAHSPADLAVWFPDQRVLLAGDLCFNRVVPLTIHGSASGWIEALDRLIALDPAVIVPGHGPLATVEDLRSLRAYLEAVRSAARRACGAGRPEEVRLTAPEAAIAAGWIEQDRTASNVRRAVAEVLSESVTPP